jgi:hypothetical protein
LNFSFLFIINFVLLRLITEYGCEIYKNRSCEDLNKNPCIGDPANKNCLNGININHVTQSGSQLPYLMCYNPILSEFRYLYAFFL